MPAFVSSSINNLLLFSLALIVCLLSCSAPEKEPVITAPEGLFINEVYTAGEDWIELYSEAKEPKNLSGYKLYDNGTVKYQLPSNTTIPANGFLIIICNDVGSGLEASFKLSSEGETVYLENTEGALVDFVEVPKLDNGQSYGRYPDGSSSWAISGYVTKATSNTNANVPAITSVSRVPLVPSRHQSVVIQAELVNVTDLNTIKLYYRFNGAPYTALTMLSEGAFYNATIPAQSTTGKLDYYVEVKSNTGIASYKPFDAPNDSYSYLLNTDVLPLLFINEFMASNMVCCADTDSGTSEFDDWIEIYNAGPTAIDIGGMYVSDDANDPFKSKVPGNNPAATTIQPGNFLVLWADEQQGQGSLHLNFKLSAAGEAVGLFYIDGRTIDTKAFGTQADDQSLGRTPNGSTNWIQFSSPTPGRSNN